MDRVVFAALRVDFDVARRARLTRTSRRPLWALAASLAVVVVERWRGC